MASSERLFAERADLNKLREAVRVLGNARNPDQRNYEVEWKFGKYSFFLGKNVPNEDEAIAIFERGRDAAKIASRLEPNKPDGHFWYGANLGELARISPVTVGIKSIDDLREAMNAVIAIDPDYQDASAYDALGQLEMATRTFKNGDVNKAIEYYKKGIELSPDNGNTRLHLAEAYFAVGENAEARKQLNELIAMKPPADYAIEHQAVVAKAKTLLEKNF